MIEYCNHTAAKLCEDCKAKNEATVSNSRLIDGLSDFASLADELEKEGDFLDNPHDHPTDRAGGKAYKESATRIREIIEKAKGR